MIFPLLACTKSYGRQSKWTDYYNNNRNSLWKNFFLLKIIVCIAYAMRSMTTSTKAGWSNKKNESRQSHSHSERERERHIQPTTHPSWNAKAYTMYTTVFTNAFFFGSTVFSHTKGLPFCASSLRLSFFHSFFLLYQAFQVPRIKLFTSDWEKIHIFL